MYGRSGDNRRAGERPRIREGLNGAAAPVDPTAKILRGSQMPVGLRFVERFDRGAASRPLLSAASRFLNRRLRVRALNPAVAHMGHIHAVPRDKVEHRISSGSGERDEFRPTLRPEHGFEIVRIVFQAGDDLAAVAARSAVTRLLRLQHDRFHAALREMQGGR